MLSAVAVFLFARSEYTTAWAVPVLRIVIQSTPPGTSQSVDFIRCRVAGDAMLRKEAEREIIREWIGLPKGERQTEHQVAQSALQMKRKYQFDYIGGDRYQEIRRMILRHHKRIADTSK
jgi:hypothetical protein